MFFFSIVTRVIFIYIYFIFFLRWLFSFFPHSTTCYLYLFFCLLLPQQSLTIHFFHPQSPPFSIVLRDFVLQFAPTSFGEILYSNIITSILYHRHEISFGRFSLVVKYCTYSSIIIILYHRHEISYNFDQYFSLLLG